MATTSPWRERLPLLWFVQLPRALYAWLPELSDVLTDGAWTWSWGLVAALAPVLSLVLGFLTPFIWLTNNQLYAGSLPFLVVTIVSSLLSGASGLATVLGYAGGDLLHGTGELGRQLGASGASGAPAGPLGLLGWSGGRLISYLLLAVPAVGLPQFTGPLARAIPVRLKLPGGSLLRLDANRLLYPVVCSVLIYLWSQGMTVLIRPAFTWRGVPLTAQSIAVFQTQWPYLVAATFGAAILRLLFERASRRLTHPSLALAKARQLRLIQDPRRGHRWRQLPAPVRIAVPAALTTLILAGAYRGWSDAALVAVVSVLIGAWRALGAPLPSRVADTIHVIPPLLRVVIAAVVGFAGYLVLRPILPGAADPSGSPFVLASALGALVCGHLLFPGGVLARLERLKSRVPVPQQSS
jgi:hypothetical protein